MLLAEPQPTSADWHFELAGIRVRVSPWFWLAAVLLGWSACQSIAGGDQRMLLLLLVLWSGTVLVSLVVHEMGHALAFRACGQGAHVVLYQFGGLAIPEAWNRRVHLRPLQRLLVSAAGPAAQLALAAALVLLLRAGGYAVPFRLPVIGDAAWWGEGRRIADFSLLLAALVQFLLMVNILWPLLNLVPVPPLDGGQILREGLTVLGVADAARIAAIVGVVTGGAVAWWGFSRGDQYLGILFAMLAVSCWQSLSAGTPWRRWN